MFTECEQVIKANLAKVGFDEVILMETRSWSAQKGTKFNLEKDQTICIPDNMSELILGLGWDTRADIDASVIMCNKSSDVIDLVSFCDLESKDKAVVHQGDNLTGKGDGDDE